MPVSEYKEIQGKIISKGEGYKRRDIDKDYRLVDDKFIRKDAIQEIVDTKKAPIGICAVDPADEIDKYKNWLATNSGFIEGLTSISGTDNISPLVLSDAQRYLMDSRHQFCWMDKCRQFGFSLLVAARSLSKAMLQAKSTGISVSYNEEESKEKITYARELYESLPAKYRLARKLKYDNKTSLVFERMGQQSVETRILSYPQRVIRGKGGNVDVYLDEFAYCIHAKQIYVSAIPVLSRGSSSLWMGSTPAGKAGLFYEVGANQGGLYDLYMRMHVHWWDVPEFCKDVNKARRESPFLMTDNRVNKFATERLLSIRNSMSLDDFQQEYECEYLDEQYSYFPWDLIMGCVPIFNVDGKNSVLYDSPAGDLSHDDIIRSGTGIDFFTDFEEFMKAVDCGMIEGPFLGGFDVGRTKDASEIIIMSEDPKTYTQTIRCNVTLKNMRLPEQRKIVTNMVDKLGSRLVKFEIGRASCRERV